jgi:hypothetical protein
MIIELITDGASVFVIAMSTDGYPIYGDYSRCHGSRSSTPSFERLTEEGKSSHIFSGTLYQHTQQKTE